MCVCGAFVSTDESTYLPLQLVVDPIGLVTPVPHLAVQRFLSIENHEMIPTVFVHSG